MENPIYIESPTIKSTLIPNLFYKMECNQPTLSFKVRGMDRLCRFHLNQGRNKFIASSGGNAGYSLAFVGQKLGAFVKVVVPTTTSRYMVEKIKSVGAEVEICGDVWDEANFRALQIAQEGDTVYVSPFDDPLLWNGHSTIIDECARQIDQPDKIIVSVGGGGLLCGVFEGMKKNGWTGSQVLTTETIGAASFYESWKANKVVSLKEISSVATSLGAKTITKQALTLSRDFDLLPVLVSDKEAIQATQQFFQEYNVMVEPACGAALSIPYFHRDLITENEKVLVIVCGGANVNTP